MAITVVNKRVHRGAGEYVGRPTALGNPFIVGVHGAQGECVEKFRVYLWDRIKQKDPVIMAALQRLVQLAKQGDVTLVCWCKPRACHADVIKAAVEWLIQQGI